MTGLKAGIGRKATPANHKKLNTFATLVIVIVFCLLQEENNLKLYLTVQQNDVDGTTATNAAPITPKDSKGDETMKNYQLVLTDYGWNTLESLQYPRRIVETQYYEAIKSHSRFNSSGWTNYDFAASPPLIVFLDLETCLEENFPKYLGGLDTWATNMDVTDGRSTGKELRYGQYHSRTCTYIKRAAEDARLRANPLSRLVVMDCIPRTWKMCNTESDRLRILKQVSMAHLSIHDAEVRPGVDFGLPPPAIAFGTLNVTEQENLCSKRRKYTFSFRGRQIWHYRIGLENMLKQNLTGDDYYIEMQYSPNVKNIVVQNPRRHKKRMEKVGQHRKNPQPYLDLMMDSYFVGAPRGVS